MKTKKSILQVLDISYIQYDNYRESEYQKYCLALSGITFISYRKLHVNDYMRNYFSDMWLTHVERSFLRDNADYFELCEPKLLRELFVEYSRKIIDKNEVQMYPIALLKDMKKEAVTKNIN